MRGNLARDPGRGDGIRSIPASAGEPALGHAKGGRHGVYPRECGGTAAHVARQKVNQGLSPRVRGNPLLADDYTWYIRSIPASAGEPLARYVRVRRLPVYPRECGGTPNRC